jgi:hypothetical protein
MVAVTGLLIGGIARGVGSQGALVRARLPGDHQPFLGSGAFALDPGLNPARPSRFPPVLSHRLAPSSESTDSSNLLNLP